MRYEKTFNEKTRRKRLAAELAEPKANSSAASEANNETVDHIEEEKAVGENELIEDARTRQAIGNKNLQCDHCELTTRSKSILTRHMKRMHVDKQTAIVQEEPCFSSQELIEDARTRKAIGNKNLQCDHCELTTRSKSILTRYMKLMHIEQTAIVQGDHCDDKSHSPNNVQNHINLVHGD